MHIFLTINDNTTIQNYWWRQMKEVLPRRGSVGAGLTSAFQCSPFRNFFVISTLRINATFIQEYLMSNNMIEILSVKNDVYMCECVCISVCLSMSIYAMCACVWQRVQEREGKTYRNLVLFSFPCFVARSRIFTVIILGNCEDQMLTVNVT